MTDYYRILNLQPTATPLEIKAAYARERAELLAIGEGDDERIAEQLSALEHAYVILSDPNQRTAYDRSLRAGSQVKDLILVEQPAAIIAPQAPPVPVVQQACPHPKCGALNPIQATMCGQCGKQISHPCPKCGQPVVLGQTVCARCNTIIREYNERRLAKALVTEKRVDQERRVSESRVVALEAIHRANAKWGVLFWLVVTALCIGLTVAAVFLYNYFTLTY